MMTDYLDWIFLFHIEQAMEQIFQIAGNSLLKSELYEIWTCWHWAKLHPYTCKNNTEKWVKKCVENSLNLFQNSLNMCLIYWMITGTSGWLHMFTVMVASSLPFWIRNLSDLCAFDMVYQIAGNSRIPSYTYRYLTISDKLKNWISGGYVHVELLYTSMPELEYDNFDVKSPQALQNFSYLGGISWFWYPCRWQRFEYLSVP